MSSADDPDQPELSIREGQEPHKKRRKRTGWDAPTDHSGSSYEARDSRKDGASSSGSSAYGSSQTLDYLLESTQRAQQASEHVAAALQKKRAQEHVLSDHQRRLACRLYVGSLHYDVKESDIRAIFSPFGTIAQIDMSFDQITGKSKGYCFVEFADIESTRRALETMNGFNLAGRQLRVGRPSNMGMGGPGGSTEAAPPAMPGALAAEGLAQASAVAHDVNSFFQAQVQAQSVQLANIQKTGGTSKGQCTRIYVGSVAFEINSDVLQRVFEPFGTIRRCQLLPDNNIPGKHRGYGFIEFEDERAAVAAISRMDGFALLGRQLRVAWASNPTATPMAGGAPPSQPSLSGDTIKDAVERIQKQQARHHSVSRYPYTQSGSTPTAADVAAQSGANSPPGVPALPPDLAGILALVDEPSVTTSTVGSMSRFQVMSGSSAEETLTWRCILLMVFDAAVTPCSLGQNMVSPEEADDPGLMTEIFEEAKKFGKVEETHLHKVGNPRTKKCVDVRIFVLYSSPPEARNALNNFRNRLFGGKKVSCELYDHNLYRQRRFQFADG